MSGLQLPEDTATGGGLDAALSLAVSQTTTYQWSLADSLSGLVRAGIGGVGLYRPKLEEVEEEIAVDLVRASGLSVSSISWIGGFTGSDGSRQDEAVFDAIEALRFAEAVGAGTVCAVSGAAGTHIAKHARRLLADTLKRVCDEAPTSVRLALHPAALPFSYGGSLLTTLDATSETITAVNRENLGLAFDTAHFAGEPGLLDRLSDFVELTHVVKLTERRPRSDRRSVSDSAPTTAEIVEAFVDAGYAGPFEFDLWLGPSGRREDYDAVLADCRARFETFGVIADSSS